MLAGTFREALCLRLQTDNRNGSTVDEKRGRALNRYSRTGTYSDGCNNNSCCMSLILLAGERGCCDFAVKLARSLRQRISSLLVSLPGPPNQVLYSLSRCVQTAMLQVIQTSCRDAQTQPQELHGAKTGWQHHVSVYVV